MTTNISREVADRIAGIVKDALSHHGKPEVVFDPVKVVPKIDRYAGEYLHVYIVYDCDPKLLDVKWRMELRRMMRPQFMELGVEFLPNISYIQRQEWDEEGWEEFLREWRP